MPKLSLRFPIHMGWHDLAFLHWHTDPAEVAARLPEGWKPDTFDGKAWWGVVAFRMHQVHPPFWPGVLSPSFPELNLRTYARDTQGRTGVFFLRLETAHPSINWLARTLHGLPYRTLNLALNTAPEGVCAMDGPTEKLHWKPEGERFLPTPGTLEFFLTERYQFLLPHRRGVVNHESWPLQKAALLAYETQIFERCGLAPRHRAPDHVLCSQGIEVRAQGG